MKDIYSECLIISVLYKLVFLEKEVDIELFTDAEQLVLFVNFEFNKKISLFQLCMKYCHKYQLPFFDYLPSCVIKQNNHF